MPTRTMKDRLHDCAVRISKLVKLNAPLCILAKEVEYFDFLASEVWREAGTTYAALLEEHERLTDKGKDV